MFLNLPFGETMAEQKASGYYNNAYKFNGKEQDAETGLYYYGARYYDPRSSVWLNVDPLASDFPSWTPYHYVHDNPINLIDPTGMEATRYEDENGNEIATIDDGSNAVFQLTGDSRSNQYFKFKNYDEILGGKDEVNIQGIIDFTQDYTRENYTSTPVYKKDADGIIINAPDGNPEIDRWITYCNYGTRCIGKSVASGLEEMGINMDISVLQGRAVKISKALAEHFEPLTLEDAQESSKNGSFIVGGWSSHVFTLNKDGKINNVGAPRATNNIWDPKYSLPKTTKFYELYKPKAKN